MDLSENIDDLFAQVLQTEQQYEKRAVLLKEKNGLLHKTNSDIMEIEKNLKNLQFAVEEEEAMCSYLQVSNSMEDIKAKRLERELSTLVYQLREGEKTTAKRKKDLLHRRNEIIQTGKELRSEVLADDELCLEGLSTALEERGETVKMLQNRIQAQEKRSKRLNREIEDLRMEIKNLVA